MSFHINILYLFNIKILGLAFTGFNFEGLAEKVHFHNSQLHADEIVYNIPNVHIDSSFAIVS